MTSHQPSPPDDLQEGDDFPDELVELLEDQRPDRLRELARYVEDLAAHRERTRQSDRDQFPQEPPRDRDDRPPNDRDDRDGREDEEGEEDKENEKDETPTESAAKPDDRPANPPDDVPGKATLTVKEINDNRYYYWQWREGDTVTSRYEGPVDPDE